VSDSDYRDPRRGGRPSDDDWYGNPYEEPYAEPYAAPYAAPTSAPARGQQTTRRNADHLRADDPYGPPAGGRSRPAPAILAARGLAAFASATLLLVTGFVWYANHSLTSGLHTSDSVNAAKPGEQGYIAPHLGNDVNLLLIGLDSRKDMNGNDLPTSLVENDLHAGSSAIGGYNTNVLILMHIPSNGGQVTAYSIPRDDYVERPAGSTTVKGIPNYPDLGKGKIKEAYGDAKTYAESKLVAQGVKDKATLESMSREVGRTATINAVQLLTGEHIDHLAEINLKGFYDIVSAIGDIQVCLKAPANDPIEDGAGTGINLSAGLHTIDAATALQFVRQRFHLQNGDLDRTHRQQAFLSSVTHKLKSEGILGDLGKMQSLFNVVKSDVVIDDNWDVITFGMEASNLTGGNTTFYTLPIKTTADVPDGSGVPGHTTSVNLVDPAAIKATVQAGFKDGAAPVPPPTTSAAAPSTPAAPATTAPAAPKTTIEVDNGTIATGFASKVAGYLFDNGIPVSKTGNGSNVSRTTIRYGAGGEATAKDIAAKLGTKAVPTSSSSLAANTVVVLIGSDYKLPKPTAPAGSSTGGNDGTATPSGGSSGSSSSDSDSSGISNGGPINAADSIDGVPCVY
jgi:LCP family protein required for cell wall assembly